jgi:hypothetical protein
MLHPLMVEATTKLIGSYRAPLDSVIQIWTAVEREMRDRGLNTNYHYFYMADRVRKTITGEPGSGDCFLCLAVQEITGHKCDHNCKPCVHPPTGQLVYCQTGLARPTWDTLVLASTADHLYKAMEDRALYLEQLLGRRTDEQ